MNLPKMQNIAPEGEWGKWDPATVSPTDPGPASAGQTFVSFVNNSIMPIASMCRFTGTS
jgi:hypothetical protein